MRSNCSLGSAQTGAEQGESRTGLSGALPRPGEELQESLPANLPPSHRDQSEGALSPEPLLLSPPSVILPLIPQGAVPSAPYVSPAAPTGSRPRGSVATMLWEGVCNSYKQLFLNHTLIHKGRLLGPHSPYSPLSEPDRVLSLFHAQRKVTLGAPATEAKELKGRWCGQGQAGRGSN